MQSSLVIKHMRYDRTCEEPGMQQVAFLMRLKPGYEAEYRKRHDAIWPELKEALQHAGIYDYSIYLEADTLKLFAVMKLRPDNTNDALPTLPVMRRWWDYMADLMDVDATNKPVERPLKQIFHMD
jgi:L-rhamnose mutarotase